MADAPNFDRGVAVSCPIQEYELRRDFHGTRAGAGFRCGGFRRPGADATRDKVAMGVGLMLFWPALFSLAAGDEKAELARLKGEFEAMDTAYGQKTVLLVRP